MKPTELLTFLPGNWYIEREIIQREKTILAKGKALFSPTDDGLEYSEEIDLDANIHSSQQYLYKLEGDKIHKYFKDGGLFYELDERGYGEHICKDDLYKAEYKFQKDSFYLLYKVSGPKKDYLIKTKYNKKD